MESKLYYEAHVTIEPVFDARLSKAIEIAKEYDYRVADLLMQKRSVDTPERSKFDTFMTSRNKNFETICERTRLLVQRLQDEGYKVWRYKVEDTLLDSQLKDEMALGVGR